MTDLVWDQSAEKIYEVGVEQGILYPMTGPGVVWNGLVSVDVNVSGGEAEEYYFDGVKYMDVVLAEDFEATITAFSAPAEFAACEGYKSLTGGMSTPYQQRQKFGLCWRTRVGNEVEGTDFAYKLHLVYNATVSPAPASYETIGVNVAPGTKQWTIRATPACGRYAYYIFDSREAELSILEAQLLIGNLPHCSILDELVDAGSGITPLPPCPSLSSDFEEFVNSQLVSETIVEADVPGERHILGKINSGIKLIELPANGTFTVNDSLATVVGTGTILADADDASYISSAHGDLGYTVGLPPLVGYIPGSTLELHVRMSLTGDVNEDDPDEIVDADAQIFVTTDADGDLAVGGFSDGSDDGMSFKIPFVDGTIASYIMPLDMSAWVDKAQADVVAALEAGAYLNVVSIVNNNFATTPEARVYEASIVIINSTDADKYLQAADAESTAFVEHHIFDEDADVMYHSIKAWVDFKLLEHETESDAVGDLVKLFTWEEDPTHSPGMVRIEIASPSNTPNLKWYQDETIIGAPSILTPLLKDVWYTAEMDFNIDNTAHFRVVLREAPTVYLLDVTRTTITTPLAFVKNFAGMVGTATKTYEVVIDNARMYTECNEIIIEPEPPDEWTLMPLGVPTLQAAVPTIASPAGPLNVGSGNIWIDNNAATYTYLRAYVGGGVGPDTSVIQLPTRDDIGLDSTGVHVYVVGDIFITGGPPNGVIFRIKSQNTGVADPILFQGTFTGSGEFEFELTTSVLLLDEFLYRVYNGLPTWLHAYMDYVPAVPAQLTITELHIKITRD